ncbi:MAG: class I SAM-dependent methyltransferase [Acidobacteriota bacterium]
MNDQDQIEARRARARDLAAQFADRGDSLGWFDAFYKEAGGDNEQIPWADLEPNRFFKTWAGEVGLTGNGRNALVVGCGLGDDAKYLDDLGFEVTAFDISPTAIEWAKRLYGDTDIHFEVADLFEAPSAWVAASDPPATAGGTDKNRGFDFVLEVYTIQPLPVEMRPMVIDAVAAFVAGNGELVVVTRGREDDEEPVELPWPLSRKDLSRFETHGLTQTDFRIMDGDEDPPCPRFVVRYRKYL